MYFYLVTLMVRNPANSDEDGHYVTFQGLYDSNSKKASTRYKGIMDIVYDRARTTPEMSCVMLCRIVKEEDD